MKFFLITIIAFFVSVPILGQKKSKKSKKDKPVAIDKEAKEVDAKKDVDTKVESKEVSKEKEIIAANTVIFRVRDLGKVWEISEKANQLIFSPDSMRMTSKYKKFVFDLGEFKKMGGNLGQDSSFTIEYSVLKTDIESKIPDDPNLPSPSGGFTFIINTCKIEKVEAN